MITVRIKGGLGNQLFQYASAYALAKRLGQDLIIDASFYPNQTLRGYKLHLLAIEYSEQIDKLPLFVSIEKNRYINRAMRLINVQTFGNQTQYILETRSSIVPAFFETNKKNIYLDGYYQSELYFLKYRTEILSQFIPVYQFEEEFLSTLRTVNSTNSIAVHVRRGDFLKAQYNSNPRHYLLGEQYYYNAISYIEHFVESPQFFWFSDDIDWVKKTFGERDDFKFINLNTKNPDIDELMLMKNCKHIITANSTFSWWASWLNNQEDSIHICPSKRYGNEKMIPHDWIKIDVE